MGEVLSLGIPLWIASVAFAYYKGYRHCYEYMTGKRS